MFAQYLLVSNGLGLSPFPAWLMTIRFRVGIIRCSADIQRRAFLILAAIQAERVIPPRSASSLSHSSGGRLMLDVVTVRPVPVPGGRPAPSLAPPRVGVGFFFMVGKDRRGIEPRRGRFQNGHSSRTSTPAIATIRPMN